MVVGGGGGWCGGVKGFLNNVKKTALLFGEGFPNSKKVNFESE